MKTGFSATGMSRSRGERILYAEDNDVFIEMLRIFLAGSVDYLDFASDGREALARIREAPHLYRLLITDHAMPEMDGLALVRAVRGCHFKGRVIVFSGEISDSVVEEYRTMSVHTILRKSQDLDLLLSIIRSADTNG
ncbi:hypothetical protein OPIT5_28365 [Opitutaceae bacterium TAV5]|nr:hypothetical protein OPIT5_28365 [Opitutaceae bacterium TAV5]